MNKFDEVQMDVLALENRSQLSDGSHTYEELYHHRGILFAVICNSHKDLAWKSKLHNDGTMFYGDFFIVGIDTPQGQFTYHYKMEMWDSFVVKELERAPKWDGHEPKDVTRLFSLL